MPGRWLPHPARTIRQPRTCPTGEPRFATASLALQSVPAGLPIAVTTTGCEQCGGVHLVRPEPRRNP